MRILILNRVEPPAPGATGRLVAELAAHLRNENHEVETITTGKLQPKIIPYILSLISIGFRALFAKRADCVVVMTDPPMLPLWIPFLNLRHGKIIHWCQDLYPDVFPIVGVKFPAPFQRALMDIKRTALQSAHRHITLGRCMAARLKNYANDIDIIPNWAERDITPAEISENEPLTILYAGNIGMVHPVDEIAAAIQSCCDLPVKFIMMTGGKGEKTLREKLSGQRNVTFMEPQAWERAKSIQAMSHVHLIALKDEALGMAMPVKTYAAIKNARPFIFLGPDACEAAQLICEYDCGDVIANHRAADLQKIIRTYINPDGTPGLAWQEKHRRIREIRQPDSLLLVAEKLLAA